MNYAIVKEFLLDLKKTFENRDDKIIKIVKLKKIKQENKIIEKFV